VRLAITGLGLATPAGCDDESFWRAMLRGTPVFEEVDLYGDDTRHPAGRVAGEIGHGWPRRQARRVDRFTLLAMAAVRQALRSARFEVTEENGARVGIIVGNATGGWSFVEPQLYPLYRERDLDAVDSYVATAWFPTAAQGEISIDLGIRGFSKTIAGENLSSGFALRQARHAIADGRLDVVVVCGAEAPLTPLVHSALLRHGTASASGTHRPFHPDADGSVLAEGAAALVVESADRVRRRTGRAVAEVAASALGPDLATTMAACRARGPVDCVLLDGRATPGADRAERRALALVFADRPDLPAGVPGVVYGNLLGATLAVDIVTACLALRHRTVPATAAGPLPLPGLRHVLVNATDDHGQAMSLLIKAWENR